MPEFLAAEKQGRVKIIGTPAPIGRHDVSSTRVLKSMLATFLEKSVVFHMPHPGLHIDGVPNEDDQGKPFVIPGRMDAGPREPQ